MTASQRSRIDVGMNRSVSGWSMKRPIWMDILYCNIREVYYFYLLLRPILVKGVGHLDHVRSYGVREVVSSIPDRGNIVGWVFHPTQVTGTVSSSEHAFPSKILNLFRTLSSWGSGNYRPSAPLLYEVASHVKNCHSGHYYYYYYTI